MVFILIMKEVSERVSEAYAVCVLLYMVGKSVNGTVIAGFFTAGGDTRFGFLCDTINLWCLIFLAAFVFKWSVPVVYLLLNLDEFSRMPFEWHHYHKYKWVRNLTQESGGLRK